MRGFKAVSKNYEDWAPWAGTREYRVGESYEGIEKEEDGMWDDDWDVFTTPSEKLEMLGHLLFESVELAIERSCFKEDVYAGKVRFLEVEGYGEIVGCGCGAGWKAENLRVLREIPQDKIRKLLR